jgi:hypothetical protein
MFFDDKRLVIANELIHQVIEICTLLKINFNKFNATQLDYSTIKTNTLSTPRNENGS